VLPTPLPRRISLASAGARGLVFSVFAHIRRFASPFSRAIASSALSLLGLPRYDSTAAVGTGGAAPRRQVVRSVREISEFAACAVGEGRQRRRRRLCKLCQAKRSGFGLSGGAAAGGSWRCTGRRPEAAGEPTLPESSLGFTKSGEEAT
jgi:hypothetical protein